MLWTESDDARVAVLDPLGVDHVMSKVPEWNAAADTHELTRALDTMCARASLDTRTHDEVLAIIRDMGILMGSLRKHGQEPCAVVPALTGVLVRAGILTDLTPRDTLMHYTVWNPPTPRLRRYTDHPQEQDLVHSIKKSLPAIRDATRHLFEMRDYALHHQRAFRNTHLIAHRLKHFLLGLHHAMRHVEPAVFILQFRPFFEPIAVGPTMLRGPGAVTMPLHVFDYLFWGSSESHPQYQQFTADYIPYNTAEFRQYYCRARNTPSLIDRLEQALARSRPPAGALALLSPLVVCMKRVRAFRNAHLKYAFKAYHGEAVHSFRTGSGGHTTTDLEVLSNLTQKHAQRLDALCVRFLPTETPPHQAAPLLPPRVIVKPGGHGILHTRTEESHKQRDI